MSPWAKASVGLIALYGVAAFALMGWLSAHGR